MRRLGWLPSFAPFRHPGFAVVAMGNFVSQLGTWSQIIGIGWAAQRLTQSPFLVSVAFGAQFLPSLFAGPVGGLIADRIDRRRITIAGNVGMALPAGAIGLLLAVHHLGIWGLIALALAGGVMQALTQPAMSALVPHLVPSDEVPAAVALNSALQNLSRFIGASLAGLLISNLGTPAAFYFNAASFFAVVVAWTFVRLSLPKLPTSDESFLGTLAGGLRYAREHPDIRDILLLNTVVALCVVQQPLLPLITSRVLHAGSGTYGGLNSCIGIGAIAGALLAGRRMAPRAVRITFGSAVCVIGAAIVCVGLSHTVAITGAVLVVYGVAFFCVLTTTMSTVMLRTPDHFRGRVMALQTMSIAGMVPVSALIAGFSASHVGLETTVVVAGTVLIAYATWFVAAGRLAAVSEQPTAGTLEEAMAEVLAAHALNDATIAGDDSLDELEMPQAGGPRQ